MTALAIVRIRGTVRVRHTIKTAMASLNLTRANHCVIVPAEPHWLGTVRKVKDYVTYGPVTAEQVESLIRERGRLVGDAPVTDDHVKAHTPYGSIRELAQAVAEGTFVYKDLPSVKPLFRLSPPRQGFKGGVKRSWQAHGSLGDRGPAMGELLARMI